MTTNDNLHIQMYHYVRSIVDDYLQARDVAAGAEDPDDDTYDYSSDDHYLTDYDEADLYAQAYVPILQERSLFGVVGSALENLPGVAKKAKSKLSSSKKKSGSSSGSGSSGGDGDPCSGGGGSGHGNSGSGGGGGHGGSGSGSGSWSESGGQGNKNPGGGDGIAGPSKPKEGGSGGGGGNAGGLQKHGAVGK